MQPKRPSRTRRTAALITRRQVQQQQARHLTQALPVVLLAFTRPRQDPIVP